MSLPRGWYRQTCRLCGAYDPIVPRLMSAAELNPTVTITAGTTMKSKPNPHYRPPDVGHTCTGRHPTTPPREDDPR